MRALPARFKSLLVSLPPSRRTSRPVSAASSRHSVVDDFSGMWLTCRPDARRVAFPAVPAACLPVGALFARCVEPHA